MRDYSRGVEVTSEQDDRTGKWWVTCPECKKVIKAMTNDGINNALSAHMNERHFMPKTGNA